MLIFVAENSPIPPLCLGAPSPHTWHPSLCETAQHFYYLCLLLRMYVTFWLTLRFTIELTCVSKEMIHKNTDVHAHRNPKMMTGQQQLK